MLVTSDGYKNMSGALARPIPDIEAFMARAQKEVRADFIPRLRRRDDAE